MIFAWAVAACAAPSEPQDAAPGVDGSLRCVVDRDCDDTLFCNGVEACRPLDVASDGRGCVHGTIACPAGSCDETADRCAGCATDTDGDGEPSVECGGADCDDHDADVHPGASETCDAAGVDEDCNPSTYGARDRDGDHEDDATCCNGLTCGSDCDDTAPGSNHSSPEVCDGRDNDCDSAIDEGTTVTCFVDADGDGYPAAGAASSMQCTCPPRTTRLEPAGADIDCDDRPGIGEAVSPVATEVCVDGSSVDEDCDGLTDEGLLRVCYVDADGDGYALATATPMQLCVCGSLTTATPPSVGADCDDRLASVSPAGMEGCMPDGINQDCDALTDESGTRWYPDCDHDGYGAGTFVTACSSPGVPPSCAGGTYSTLPGDCNDANAMQKPMLPDLCNGFDDDCDPATANGSGERTPGGAVVLGMPCDDADDADQCTSNGTTVCTGTLTCMETGPNRIEQCNASDDDCDGTVDEAAAANAWCAANLAMVPHATASVCSAGTCVPTTCQTGWNDCGSAPGCEIACQWRGCSGTACADPTRVSAYVDSASNSWSCAVRNGGGVACWGWDGTMTRAPTVVAGITNAVDVDRSCVLRADGSVVILGNGFAAGAPVAGVTNATQVSCGSSNVQCAVRSDRTIVCFNSAGSIGVLGNGTTSGTLGTVSGITDAVQVAAGFFHACARRASGSVVCWGLNHYGQLGDGIVTHGTCMYGSEPYDCATSPVTVAGITDAVDIAAGYLHTCALRANGDVMCWGLGNALGDGTTHGTTCSGWLSMPTPVDCARTPVRIAPASPAMSLDAAGYLSGMGLVRSTGALATWSQSDSFLRDSGSTSPTDYAVAGGSSVQSICSIDAMGLRCGGTRVASP